MIDNCKRTIDYIRISITDRCNLRCVYCMQEDGVEYISHEQILSFEEILRLAHLFSSIGINKIKVTGGEPLCRKGVDSFIDAVKKTPGIEQVTLTTNGVALDQYQDALIKAGIDGINISLDTMDRELYQKLTRRDQLDRVVTNIKNLIETNQVKVKINCVPMTQEQNLVDIAAWAKNYPVHVRFIEMMPIGFGNNFDIISREDVIALLEETYGTMHPVSVALGNGPAEYYEIDGFVGKIGFISAISHKFCADCNRIRLTPQGFLKNCLQYESGVDLRSVLRDGSSDETIREIIIKTIEKKPDGHHFLDGGQDNDEKKSMFQIGG